MTRGTPAPVTRSVTTIAGTPGSGAAVRTTLGGSAWTGQVWSILSVTRSAERTAAPASASWLPGSTRRPRPAPNSSGAVTPAASLAVVITAVAPSTSATARARLLARPACAPTTGTANVSVSSTHTTPGSVPFDASSGATSRTVAPTARKQTIWSHSAKARAIARGAGSGYVRV